MLCYIMLCYVMLCYAMFCYVMLCYVMLYYVIPYVIYRTYIQLNDFPIVLSFNAFIYSLVSQLVSQSYIF